MERRILDLTGEAAHLKKARGALLIRQGDNAQGREIRVPFDEIEAVVVHAREVGYSNDALLALAAAGTPLILCDQAHRPRAWLWPAEANFEQARRMRAPTRLRSTPAQTPLGPNCPQQDRPAGPPDRRPGTQCRAIGGYGTAGALRRRRQHGGDGRQRYWPLLMGGGFRRDHRLAGPNALLNYGYTVLRAVAARYAMAAGLHPSLGLHHHNRFNAFCLADDLMEPFRPRIDAAVIALIGDGIQEVTPEAKLRLVAVMAQEVEVEARLCAPKPVRRAIGDIPCTIHPGGHECLGPAQGPSSPPSGGASWIIPGFSGYRLMWMLVMFDLPVALPRQRKRYTRFRHKLLDLGFEMAQFSVYMKFCPGRDYAETLAGEVARALPREGAVSILTITDKQYARNESLPRGRAKIEPGRAKSAASALIFLGDFSVYFNKNRALYRTLF